MDTLGLHGVTGSAQAGTTPPAPAKPSSPPSLLETLNPFAPSTIPKSAGQIASKAGQVGSFVGSSSQQEKAGEAIGSALNPIKLVTEIEKAVGELVTAFGLRLLQVLSGGALVIFGLMTLAKGDTPSLGPIS